MGRRNRADRYRKLFDEAGLTSFISYPPAPPERFLHVYNQFTIRRQNERDNLKAFLLDKGVPSEIYYPLPLHLQPAFKFLGYREGDMPQAENASQEVLSLPVYPELSDLQQDLVVQSLAEFCRFKG